jgi:hypothetical protein
MRYFKEGPGLAISGNIYKRKAVLIAAFSFAMKSSLTFQQKANS